MQFGVVLPGPPPRINWDVLWTIARKAEKSGYDSVWVSDHFTSPSGRPSGLEAWTVLSALASSTPKIRLGTYVLCNQFRHPSLLAKMASTLDNISKGRLEFGIGAGWIKNEHVTFGFNWDKHEVRLNRLKESVEIIKKLWTEDHVSYNGKHFQLKDATLEPKPFQQPHPRLWIGGNSEPIRKLVAKKGDGWIPVLPTEKQLADGTAQIKQSMRIVGRNPHMLHIAYGGSGCAIIAERQEQVRKLAEPLTRSAGKPIEELSCLIGTPEQCIHKIERYKKAGAQMIVAGFYDFPSMKGLELFAKSVIPHFR